MSRQETKKLFNGWRSFLSESLKARGKRIRIFDFDGTLYEPPPAVKAVGGAFNFYLPLFTDEAISRMADLHEGDEGKFNKNIKLTQNDYIVSLVSSGGFPKGEDAFLEYAKKKDRSFMAIMTGVLQVEGFDKALEALDAGKEAPMRKLIQKYFDLTGDTGGLEAKKAAKRALISSFISNVKDNFPDDHILISDNLADVTTDEYSSLMAVKGTSGKRREVEKIVEANPDATIEIYDNTTYGLIDMRRGALNAKAKASGAFETMKKLASNAGGSGESDDEETPVSLALAKIAFKEAEARLADSLNLTAYTIDAETGNPQLYGGRFKGGKSQTTAQASAREKTGPMHEYRQLKNLLISIAGSGVIIPRAKGRPDKETPNRAKAVIDKLHSLGLEKSANAIAEYASSKIKSGGEFPHEPVADATDDFNKQFVHELAKVADHLSEFQAIAPTPKGAADAEPAAEPVAATPAAAPKKRGRPAKPKTPVAEPEQPESDEEEDETNPGDLDQDLFENKLFERVKKILNKKGFMR
jgi:hypothetical protein